MADFHRSLSDFDKGMAEFDKVPNVLRNSLKEVPRGRVKKPALIPNINANRFSVGPYSRLAALPPKEHLGRTQSAFPAGRRSRRRSA